MAECTVCEGSRWKRVDVDGIEQVVRCDCWHQSLTDRLMADARVPTRFARCDLSTFEHDMDSQREAWRKAQAVTAGG